MFLTGSHSSVIDAKDVFVTVGMPGVGGLEPSPANIDNKFLTCTKNSQLPKQLMEFCYDKKKTTEVSMKCFFFTRHKRLIYFSQNSHNRFA